MPRVSQHSQNPDQVAHNSMLMQSQETHYPLVYIGTCINLRYINTSMHTYMHLKEVIFKKLYMLHNNVKWNWYICILEKVQNKGALI